jgi:hypothetical protein
VDDTFDGKDHPIENTTLDGKPNAGINNIFSAKKIDDNTIDITTKNRSTNGVTVARNVVSKDGKTRTVTRTSTTQDGKPAKTVLVFERQ